MTDWDLVLTDVRIATMRQDGVAYGAVDDGAIAISGDRIAWVGPAGESQDAGEGTDFHAIEQGAAAVIPLKVDLARVERSPHTSDSLRQCSTGVKA